MTFRQYYDNVETNRSISTMPTTMCVAARVVMGRGVKMMSQGDQVKMLRTMDGTICLLEGECKGERDFIEFPPQPAMMWWLAHR